MKFGGNRGKRTKRTVRVTQAHADAGRLLNLVQDAITIADMAVLGDVLFRRMTTLPRGRLIVNAAIAAGWRVGGKPIVEQNTRIFPEHFKHITPAMVTLFGYDDDVADEFAGSPNGGYYGIANIPRSPITIGSAQRLTFRETLRAEGQVVAVGCRYADHTLDMVHLAQGCQFVLTPETRFEFNASVRF